METNPEIRERILAAAAQLFEQSGRKELPTVDAVRKLSRTSMNDASAVMREWRRSQIVSASAAVVSVPERVSQASAAALSTLWGEAQELANESLNVAQAAWDAERAEAETARVESARQVMVLTDQAHTASARVQEIEKRAEDLKAALSSAQGSVQRLTAELDAERGQHGRTRESLTAVSTELVTVKARAEAQAGVQADQLERLKRVEAELAQARELAAAAREEAAKLAGQAAALTAQQAELMRVIEGREGARSGPKGGKK
jgi:chromosome segregation ATPase